MGNEPVPTPSFFCFTILRAFVQRASVSIIAIACLWASAAFADVSSAACAIVDAEMAHAGDKFASVQGAKLPFRKAREYTTRDLEAAETTAFASTLQIAGAESCIIVRNEDSGSVLLCKVMDRAASTNVKSPTFAAMKASLGRCFAKYAAHSDFQADRSGSLWVWEGLEADGSIAGVPGLELESNPHGGYWVIGVNAF